MARRRRGREITIKSDETKNVIGILCLIAASLFALSYFVDSPGLDFIKKYFGGATVVGFFFFSNLSLKMFRVDYLLSKTRSLVGQGLAFIGTSALLHYFVALEHGLDFAERGDGGGILGYEISHKYLIDIFAHEGSMIIIFFLFVVAVSLTFGLSIGQMVQYIFAFFKKVNEALRGMNSKAKELKEAKLAKAGEDAGTEKMVGDFRKDENEGLTEDEKAAKEKTEKEEEPKKEIPVVRERVSIKEEALEGALVNKELNYKGWDLPPTSLLSPAVKGAKQHGNVQKNADIIEQTLQSFGVKAKVVDALVGPTVSQYAVNLALGQRAAKISNLKTDLALALAAPTGAVRIEAPIPGTSYVGIEIPNAKRETVFIRELMEANEMKENHMNLPVCVGKRIDGKNVVSDLQKMPHLLIAGATGSGKSVLTNGFIISLLMKRTPDEVRMIMVDPKQVELSDYDGIPHLLTPVITDMQKVLNSLKWAILEMEKRYTIFRLAKVRNISGYNEKLGYAAMPYIIIIIDEMADLMLTCGAEVEIAVVKLAQKARATGIHLLLATQRPSVDVLTGLIKANIPGRVGMSVATQVDSRVILDQSGAETLLGAGDMLFKEPDKARPYRLQGIWVSQDEIGRVVKFIKSQAKEVHYASDVTEKQAEPGAPPSAVESVKFSDDEFFADAVRIVCSAKKGSASLLQRKLSIGYNRAARLLDELYKVGVVGDQEGSKPRKVLVSDPEAFLKTGSSSGEANSEE
ncbi:MAG: DNA translocase FtsK 4TM domain-containing protein [Candidatus Dojkabacteria bacterium]|nr:DNA translocase FtsK 4TM domain-containing protein [Candidatus Dojkabacteria bacterium]